MLPKINRIKKKKDFEGIFKNGKTLTTSFFILKISKNQLGVSRVGFVVSKKISPKATIRNKVRRRLSGVVEKEIEKIKNGTDLVFIALPGIRGKTFGSIKEATEKILIKAGTTIKV